MSWEDRITVDPEVRSGKACIKGTRITVYDVLEYLVSEACGLLSQLASQQEGGCR